MPEIEMLENVANISGRAVEEKERSLYWTPFFCGSAVPNLLTR